MQIKKTEILFVVDKDTLLW